MFSFDRFVSPALGLAAFVTLAGVVAPATAGAATVTVGPGTDCDFHDLQAALDAVADDPLASIRLGARQLRDLSVTASPAGQLSIAGGFADCSATSATGTTDLLGTFSATVVTVDAPSGAEVILSDVLISQGSAPDGSGGGLVVRGGAGVFLVDVIVNGNDARSGGGVLVDGGMLVLATSVVSGNRVVAPSPTAPLGGGIHCRGAARVELRAASRILANSADGGAGGGIFMEGGCELFVTSSTFDVPSGVESNRAKAGGGVFAVGSSRIVLQGDRHTPVVVRGNRAEPLGDSPGFGGGIAIVGSGSSLIANNVLLDGNRAPGGQGGALMVLSGARALVQRTLGPGTCHTPDRCSRLTANEAAEGAAAYVAGVSSHLEIRNSFVEGNFGFHSVLAAESGGEVRLEGSVAGENTGLHLVALDEGAHGRIAFSTIAANELTGFDVLSVVGGASLELHASIVFEAQKVLATVGPGTLDVRCVLASEIQSLGMGREVVAGDPGFVDAPNDYHLIGASPAIDFCPASMLGGELPLDLDLAPRGVDATPSDRILGAHVDVGADENGSGEGIFVDGFESGDTSGWNAGI